MSFASLAVLGYDWAVTKRRILELKRERESCEVEYTGSGAYDDPSEPACYNTMRGDRATPTDEWCGPCQRNQARYLLRCYFQKKLASLQRLLLKAVA